uniref:extensin-3-like n=1 Tax=Erigeron canadensis TaxID=72917 RepID=UPI001CB8EA71|nr:extensin-3-like [Erigeron canadensis]
MVPENEKPRVTQIRVRIDCNGCVQKIKKALHGINGIQDIYIDIPQQKLTIIGWAEPAKIVKAIKKTRKLVATICLETEQSPMNEPHPGDGADAPPPDPSPAESVPPAEPVEPPKEPENPPREPAQEPSRSSEAEEVHVVHHYNPPDHGQRYSHDRVHNVAVQHYSSSPSPVYKHEPPQPIQVNHSYNTYKPTPYVTHYSNIRPPPQYSHYNTDQPAEPPQQSTHFNRPEPPPQHIHYTRAEPPPQSTHFNRPETPPQRRTHYARPEPPPPPQFSRPELPLHHTHYKRSEPPPLNTQYNKPEPPPQYTHFNQSEPPYTHYSRTEPPQPYSNYSQQPEPPLHYTTPYSGEYYSSSNGSGNITSIFSDENPNACTIV